ncbi:MAG: HAMP domain-containing sensor histidine kinase [Inconstantimicrobium porci]|uniref:sensor histidine kinase n=1 Tax=Inconstantimicrobium porci TaxID=2652291 RepID=UPI002A90BC12|nr:HAMP domain-containing sensor histidine kinase [Inconstantimicrobium porci]MDY5911323.1 HAMP domain-containing sensor histidine kinase [Inconstantimicrobium porci]
MMKIRSIDKKSKKHLLILSLASLLIIVLISCMIYMIFDKIYKNNLNTVTTIVGQLAKENPGQEESIVNSAIESIDNGYINNDSAFVKGNTLLKKYGYDKRFKFYDDDRNKKIIRETICMIIVFAIIIAVMLICIYMKFAGDFNGKMKSLSKSLDLLIEKKYLQDSFKESDGEFGVVEHKLKMVSSIMNDSIKEINSEKESLKNFISNVSHQIKTPISSIKITNSILLEKEEDKTKREFLLSCSEEINRLQWLASSLIKISNIEVGALQLNMKAKEIKETVIMALRSVYNKALDKDIEIEVDDTESCIVEHDIRWTKEAIANVLENAIKYTPRGGKISISLSRNSMGCTIAIKDNGVGIEKENINKIFKRFYRENSKEVLKEVGSGLGLYITRKVLEAQGASIIAESKKNEGSVFTIYFYV